MPKKRRETDLYAPLAAFLEKEGYTVHAEVQGADIAARREDRLLIVEMKLRFNLDVVLQAVEKQGLADETYIAVPLSGRKRWPPRWSALRELLGRLGLGVFFVRFQQKNETRVEKILPAENHRLKDKLRKKNKARAGLLREMEGRPANFNIGGSVGKKLVTAYLVKALRIAVLLNGKKDFSLKALKESGAPEDCQSILYSNFHGWFRRKGRGLYALNTKGKAALVEYAAVINELRDKQTASGGAVSSP